MISATPNSVRWDQVNRVTYRFQALNFQSDVLEALVLNSPPLSRRSRRKPIIRIADSIGNRVEFLQARSLERRSQSFDEGIAIRSKQEAKFCERSRVSHDRYVSGSADGSSILFETTRPKVIENLKGNKEDVDSRGDVPPLPNGSLKDGEELKLNSNVECKCGGDALHDSGILFDRNDDDDLEGKSKDYLIRLVKELRNQLRNLTEDHSACSKTSRSDEDQQPATSKKCESSANACNESEESSYLHDPRTDSPSFIASLDSQDSMVGNMKQLETEVLRTRQIASMFSDEITGLQSRFSNILGKVNEAATRKKSLQPFQRNDLSFDSAIDRTKQAIAQTTENNVELEMSKCTSNVCCSKPVSSGNQLLDGSRTSH